MAVTYFQRSDASDLTGPSGSGGTTRHLVASRTAGGASADLITGNMNAGVNCNQNFFTPSTDPGTDGTSAGPFTVVIRFTVQNANIGVQVFLARVNSGGTQQAEVESTQGSQTAGAATRTYTWSSPALGTWAAGDRLRIRVFATNTSGVMNQSCTFGVDTSADTIATPFAAGGQTVNLGQPAETESVPAATVYKVVALQMVRAQITWDETPATWDGLAATWDFGELETGRPVTPLRQVPAGLVAETETAQPVTLSIGGGQTIPLGLVTEAETSQGATLRENITAGLSSETETALSVAARRVVTLGQPVETETAIAVGTGGPTVVPLGLAAETETSLAATVRRAVAVGEPVETETALAAAIRETVTLGRPVETETAHPVSVGGPQIITFGQVVETETARTLTITRTVAAGQSAEAETAQSVLVLKRVTLAQLAELETAQAIVAGSFLPDPYPVHDVYRESSTRAALGAATHHVYREPSHIYREGT